MPAAVGPAPGTSDRQPLWVAVVRSWCDGGGPEEAGQFAGDGDGDDVAGLAALARAAVGAVQAVLGAVCDLQDVGGLAGLAVGQRGADARRAQVVPGRFDQQPPSERRARLADRSLRRALTRLRQRGRQAQLGHQLAR